MIFRPVSLPISTRVALMLAGKPSGRYDSPTPLAMTPPLPPAIAMQQASAARAISDLAHGLGAAGFISAELARECSAAALSAPDSGAANGAPQ